ncbi:MAG: rhodanese-like domain-containing protein [Solidesulfovibrio sp. DCME]|uniref:rhodanese-like domain-containing protein n=1 Tax=Solidesulfovibrio sp. DCME TaxID=3447380 RepID=UPI003D0E039C
MSRQASPDPIQNASPNEVRALLDTTRPGELTLLDVRLKPEYEEFHLPGARLLPLPELPDHFDDLDRDRPVVVYCRSGGRSAAAAKLLAGAGFPRVVNMLGGAMAWQGAAAVGAPDAGMTLLRGDEAPGVILRTALAMEAALGGFYQALAKEAPDAEARAVFERLAGVEERHLHYVHTLYRKATGDDTELARLLDGGATALEGGLPGERFLEQLGGAPESAREALELAASVEAQALDLYLRLAKKAAAPESAALYATLGQEEKAHLRAVSNLMKQLA